MSKITSSPSAITHFFPTPINSHFIHCVKWMFEELDCKPDNQSGNKLQHLGRSRWPQIRAKSRSCTFKLAVLPQLLCCCNLSGLARWRTHCQHTGYWLSPPQFYSVCIQLLDHLPSWPQNDKMINIRWNLYSEPRTFLLHTLYFWRSGVR